MKIKLKVKQVCAVVLTAISLNCVAQNNREADTSRVINLEEVLITVNRWEQKASESPAHFTSIRRKQIALHCPQTAADLLATSGQVYVQKSQLGGGSPMIRGFATNRILLVVDGVRFNNAIFRAGNLQNSILLDAHNTKSVEVLFGPGSVSHGSDAIGGVINYHTMSAEFSSDTNTLTTGSVYLQGASANREQTAHVHFNMGREKLASFTSLTYSSYDDLKMGRHGPAEYLRKYYVEPQNTSDEIKTNPTPLVQKPSQYNQINLLEKIKYKPAKHLQLAYALHYSKSSNIPRYDRLLEEKNGLPISAEWYYGPQEWVMNSLKVNYYKPTFLFDYLRLTLAYQNYEESRHDRKFNQGNLRHRTENVKATSVNLDLNKTIGSKGNLYYGAEFVLNNISSKAFQEDIYTQEVSGTATRYPESSKWKSYAAFITYKHYFNEKLLAKGGLRYNRVNLTARFDTTYFPFPFTSTKISNGATTGSLGFVYTLTGKLIVNASFATGFRAPNVDDMGKLFDTEPGSVIVVNSNLKPEYSYNYELGVTAKFSEKATLKSGIFHTRLKDAQFRRDYTFNGQDSIVYDGIMSKVQAIQNAANAQVWGFYVNLDANFDNGLGLALNYNYQEGWEEMDDRSHSPLRHAVPWFGDFHVKYAKNRFFADVYLNVMGKVSFKNMPKEEIATAHLYLKDENGNPYSPAWYTLNFKVNYRLFQLFTIHAGTENILDKRYRTFSSGIVAPGRNFIVGLKYRF